MTDLTYTQNEFWTHFIPQTDAGIEAFRVMANADKDGQAAVLNSHKNAVLKQLRDAGYTVKKAKPVTKKDMQKIFDELEGLGV